MCTIDVNSLADFNVNNTKQTSTFTLHASSLFTACEAQGPLPFCLVPPSTRLQSMCASTLSDYFDSVLNGAIQKVQDLPLVWDAPIIGSETDPNWITLTDVNANQIYSDGFYLGLQPLVLFQDIAMSNDFTNLWGVANGNLYTFDASSGFVETNSSGILGNNDVFQTVQLNADGTLGVVMFSNKLYFWQEDAFVDKTQTGLTYVHAQLFTTPSVDLDLHLIVVARTSTGFTFLSYAAPPPSSPFVLVRQDSVTLSLSNSVMQWVAIGSNGQQTLVAVDSPSQTSYSIYVCNNAAIGGPPVLQWTVLRPTAFLQGRFSAVCRGSFGPSQMEVLYLNQASLLLLRVALSLSIPTPTANLVLSNITSLAEPFARTTFALTSIDSTVYYGSNPTIVNFVQVATSANFGSSGSDSSPNQVVFFPDASSVFVFFADHTFWTTQTITVATSWVHDYDLFMNQDAHVSDFGVFGLVPQPLMTWFFGYFTVSIVNPGDLIVSRHEYFRFQVDPSPIVAPNQFAHTSGTLQQTNFNSLLRSGTVQFANNNNLRVLTNANSVTLWQRATTDAFSGDTGTGSFLILDADQLLTKSQNYVTLNGLYVCYADSDLKSLRVAYNVFNSGAFADYCSVSGERQSRALQRQSDFCWQSLFTSSSGTFADNRCTCIAGTRYFDIVFPGQQFSQVTTARLEHNLPCLLTTCQQPLATPEDTNVYRAVTKQCQDSPLTLCSSLLLADTGATLNLHQGVVTQKCGASIYACGQDNDCPLGASCVNGACVANCVSNADCVSGSTCIQGICVNPNPVPSNNEPSNGAKIALLVLIILSVLMLVALLLILLLRPKKKKNPSTTTSNSS